MATGRSAGPPPKRKVAPVEAGTALLDTRSMNDNDSPRHEGTDRETVAVELSPSDARVIAGGLAEFENRSRQCDDPAEQEAADYYAELQDTFMVALKAADGQ